MAGKIFIDKNFINTRVIEFSRFQFFPWAVYVVPGFSSYEYDKTIILGHFLFWSVLGFPLSLCAASIASLVMVVPILFENLQHLVFDFSIGFIVWHWYTMYFQVFSSAISQIAKVVWHHVVLSLIVDWWDAMVVD